MGASMGASLQVAAPNSAGASRRMRIAGIVVKGLGHGDRQSTARGSVSIIRRGYPQSPPILTRSQANRHFRGNIFLPWPRQPLAGGPQTSTHTAAIDIDL